MKKVSFSVAILGLYSTTTLAWPNPSQPKTHQHHNSQSSLTLLYQNNLNASDDINHLSGILLGPSTPSDAVEGCELLGETLLSQATLNNHTSDFVSLINYIQYLSATPSRSAVLIGNDTLVSVKPGSDGLTFSSFKHWPNNMVYSALCTQSSRSSQPSTSSASPSNHLVVHDPATNNSYTGYRNLKSFRFLGIPYTSSPLPRWTPSAPNAQTSTSFNATAYGPSCPQAGMNASTSSEDCLFLNIQTPYLPNANSKLPSTRLRPVLVNIHGGGFTSGSGDGSSGLDGGNLASRHDIVMVSLNYRLSTLGFLAVPNTTLTGNYGLSDQISALKWIRSNIALFGGDPGKVTIMGESAGAGSVRVLLGAPEVVQGNLVQGAVAMSNLGGGRSLGLTDGNYGTQFSEWMTITEGWEQQGKAVVEEAGCQAGTIEEQINCLRKVPAETLVSQNNVARFVLQDGNIVTRRDLNVVSANGTTAHIPVVWGTTADDGASFCNFPAPNITTLAEGIQQSLGISEVNAQKVVDSGLYPFYDTGNLTLDAFNVSQRIATDTTFKCIDQATIYAGVESKVFSSGYYYTIERIFSGYVYSTPLTSSTTH
jgi:carboxylesterase type B